MTGTVRSIGSRDDPRPAAARRAPTSAACPPRSWSPRRWSALEAVSLVVFGVVELGSLEAGKLTMGITTALFFAVYGVGLGVFAWLLYRLQSWIRAPVVLAQLIQLGVAWSFRSGRHAVRLGAADGGRGGRAGRASSTRRRCGRSPRRTDGA